MTTTQLVSISAAKLCSMESSKFVSCQIHLALTTMSITLLKTSSFISESLQETIVRARKKVWDSIKWVLQLAQVWKSSLNMIFKKKMAFLMPLMNCFTLLTQSGQAPRPLRVKFFWICTSSQCTTSSLSVNLTHKNHLRLSIRLFSMHKRAWPGQKCLKLTRLWLLQFCA